MTIKKLPFTKEKILEIIKVHPTPFYIYDEGAIRDNARLFKKAFGILPGFKEFFAVKALPNPFIMKILKEEGFGTDCSSYPELVLSEKIGTVKEDIMFSSNDTPANEYKKAKELGAIINLDDISHIPFLEKHAGLPDLISFRYNPGPARKGNVIIGDPKEAKYGFTREQLFEGYKLFKDKGVKRFGLHTMVVSNELNPKSFIDTARMMFELAVEIKEKLGIKLEFVNFGGGMGIPHKPEDKALDYNKLAQEIKELYDEIIVKNKLGALKVFMEYGRVITGPYGYLVTRVLHLKHTYKDFVGCDACMANFMRPAIYGAYHHITVLGKEHEAPTRVYDVTGSLCENNDKFAIDRKLPEVGEGDIIVIHDTGAHSHAMGFNYNGKLRSAELLLRENNEVVEIRRAETAEDYFATLDFDKMKSFKA
ncbi:diaminopimelate decarboxylase [Candidatus Woesearchaeota archaeon]|nr:diaminopimelate decarboxylase [Candidatus Woesearchaeota archaeon]